MKIKLSIFFLVLNLSLLYSQSVQWDRNLLAIGNVKSNSITLFNSSDNTIKVKLSKLGHSEKYFLIDANNSLQLIYDEITEFNKETFEDYTIQVFYDLECYTKDVERLNTLAQQRVEAKETSNFLKMLFRIIGTGIEQLSTSEDWREIGRKINLGVDWYENIESVKEHGLTQTIINNIQDRITDELIDQSFDKGEHKYTNTAVKSLNALYRYSTESTSVDISDLEAQAYRLSLLVSHNELFVYTVNYENSIQPVVDRDKDGITNLHDKCPDLYGSVHYGGCTKEELQRMKKTENKLNRKNRRTFNIVNIDLAGIYGNLTNKNQEDAIKMYNFSFMANLGIPFYQHKIGNQAGGAFLVEGAYRAGRTHLEADKATSFSEKHFSAGLSYMFTFNRHRSDLFIIQPRFGMLVYSDVSGTKIKDDTDETPIPENLFILENSANQNLLYYDLAIRYAMKSSSSGVVLGVRHQKNPVVIVNPDYTINDNGFKYPESSFYFYFGLMVHF